MASFREAVEECGLFEALQGDQTMTWFNRRKNGEEVWERLDRFFINESWMGLFPEAQIRVLDLYGSDHRPIFIRVLHPKQRHLIGGLRRFHFEDKWFLDSSFVPDFLQHWDSKDHIT
ncbi:hypothetical protein C2S52_003983 [Perilla frutescens var. hirtella]|nr:hypothetical protein C2S52_003983 [Perilla frutescens var. hirtella]